MVTVLLATAGRRTARCPRASSTSIVLGGGQAIAGIEELIMELAPGRDDGARR